MAAMKKVLGGVLNTAPFRKVAQEKWRKAGAYFNKFSTLEKTMALGGVMTVVTFVGKKSQINLPGDEAYDCFDAIEERLDRLNKRMDSFEDESRESMKNLSDSMAANEARVDDLSRGYKLV